MDWCSSVQQLITKTMAGKSKDKRPNFCPEYNALVDMTEKLCGALQIDDLFPGLITERIINIDDVEELSNEKTRRKRVEQFIVKYLHPDLSEGGTKRFQRFMSVMKRSEKCEFLVELMEERINHHRNRFQKTGKHCCSHC